MDHFISQHSNSADTSSQQQQQQQQHQEQQRRQWPTSPAQPGYSQYSTFNISGDGIGGVGVGAGAPVADSFADHHMHDPATTPLRLASTRRSNNSLSTADIELDKDRKDKYTFYSNPVSYAGSMTAGVRAPADDEEQGTLAMKEVGRRTGGVGMSADTVVEAGADGGGFLQAEKYGAHDNAYDNVNGKTYDNNAYGNTYGSAYGGEFGGGAAAHNSAAAAAAAAAAQNAPAGGTDPRDLDPVLHSPYVRKQMSALKVHRPYFLWTVTAVQVIMIIVELVVNYQRTGSVIETDPFNYMIGPSTGVLIQLGARYTPCIRYVASYDAPGLVFECPDGVSSSTTAVSGGVSVATCTMEQICGMGGFNGQNPNQWYRFITPIFLHGGIIHLIFNLMFQCRTGFEMEQDFGWWRMACIYFISGIGGFVFGGNYSGLSPSIGCSGALFGLIACLLIDLVQNWRLVTNPKWELAKLILLIIFSLLLGTIPYFDNFAHIGGFFTGFLAGLIFMPTIHYTKRDKIVKTTLLLVAVPVLILVYVLMFVGFYNAWNNCTWCKYLTCIPGMPWCESKWNSTLISN